GPHPAVAVAGRGDESAREPQLIVQVLHQQEVVPGPVVLGEPHHHTSAPAISWARDGLGPPRRYLTRSSVMDAAPSSPAGNQRMRGSRRTQANCRLASDLVLRMVLAAASCASIPPSRQAAA